MGGKVIDLAERLRNNGHAAVGDEPQLTLRQKLDKLKKTRTQVIEMLEMQFSRFLELGERYKELAAAHQNHQRLGLTLAMHAAGPQLLDEQGKIIRDEVVFTIDQRVGDALEGSSWDMIVEPSTLDPDQLVVRVRRRVAEDARAGEG